MATLCHSCERNHFTCYCHLNIAITNKTKIIILRHINEKKHFFNTAKIAQNIFENIEIFDGEEFSKHQRLNHILTKHKAAIIYYIDQISSSFEKSIHNNSFKYDYLILLDGTWKKTYKIYQLSKNLHSLPLYAINSKVKSIISVRKPPKEFYLSTFETVKYCIEKIEKRSLNHSLLPIKYIQDQILSKKKG
ncbi:MAG: DTW domain-containing protein [Bacteriovoracaceae bacterium]|jgi:DTW domain-containing protein YfiP|nr:DTW domain-containing protein [Bacteriovoracaceae bacterium]